MHVLYAAAMSVVVAAPVLHGWTLAWAACVGVAIGWRA